LAGEEEAAVKRNCFNDDGCEGVDAKEVPMPRAKRYENPNADLIKAVQDHTDQIIDFYENAGADRPVIVLDFQRQQLQGYHYNEYKVRLSKESQMVLDAEYKKAENEDKILVLVWDEATQRLLTTTFDYD
jgi:hypothetical protein